MTPYTTPQGFVPWSSNPWSPESLDYEDIVTSSHSSEASASIAGGGAGAAPPPPQEDQVREVFPETFLFSVEVLP